MRPSADGGDEDRERFGQHRPADDAAAAAAAFIVSDPSAPSRTPAEAAALAAEAAAALASSNLMRAMTPRTSMEIVQRQLPLLLLLPCDCALDAPLTRALAAVEATAHKRSWRSRFTFAYVPTDAQKVFEQIGRAHV